MAVARIDAPPPIDPKCAFCACSAGLLSITKHSLSHRQGKPLRCDALCLILHQAPQSKRRTRTCSATGVHYGTTWVGKQATNPLTNQPTRPNQTNQPNQANPPTKPTHQPTNQPNQPTTQPTKPTNQPPTQPTNQPTTANNRRKQRPQPTTNNDNNNNNTNKRRR